MKQSLYLGHEQRLHMTPQLQQAIKLLQLSTIDLQMEIQNVLESNFMLEVAEEDNENTGNKEADANDTNQEVSEPQSATETSELTSKDEMPDELPTDSNWDDVYDGSTSYSAPSSDEQQEQWEGVNSAGESLHDHLTWQMQLTPFSDTDRAIAMSIIDAINEDGYLHIPLEEIYQGIIQNTPADEEPIGYDEVEAVLHRIQQFDPLGVGSRDLKECLLVQLHHLDDGTPHLKTTIELVKNHLDALGSRDFKRIMRQMHISQDVLTETIQLIQSLDPKPGSGITPAAPEYIVPDVLVRKKNGQWTVELNPDTMPKIRINQQYAGMIRRTDNSDDTNSLRNHLQEARWFLKSLQSRNETLLKVARCIVERQRGFLDYGEEAMRPLVLRDIAETVEMHESTISRVTTQKYMHTPNGIFEFKYFFSSHVNTTEGGVCSATAIRAILKKLIAAESPDKPLSDSKLADLLMKQGIKVARRTVTKYREAMQLPSSNERKRLA
jgi:RNA polymerase sigma-54 factor